MSTRIPAGTGGTALGASARPGREEPPQAKARTTARPMARAASAGATPMISDPKIVYAEDESEGSENAELFAPLIWSLVSRFARSEAESLQIFAEIQEDLDASTRDLDEEAVASIVRKRLARRAGAQRDGRGGGGDKANVAPLAAYQPGALHLGESAPRLASCPPCASTSRGSGRPGLIKLRAALGYDKAAAQVPAAQK